MPLPEVEPPELELDSELATLPLLDPPAEVTLTPLEPPSEEAALAELAAVADGVPLLDPPSETALLAVLFASPLDAPVWEAVPLEPPSESEPLLEPPSEAEALLEPSSEPALLGALDAACDPPFDDELAAVLVSLPDVPPDPEQAAAAASMTTTPPALLMTFPPWKRRKEHPLRQGARRAARPSILIEIILKSRAISCSTVTEP